MTKEIFSNLPLFIKYLTIYNYFETQIHETWVLHRIRVYENWVPEKYDMVAKVDLTFYNLKVHVELEF